MKKNIFLIVGIVILIFIIIVALIVFRGNGTVNIQDNNITNSTKDIADEKNEKEIDETYIETIPENAKSFIELLKDDEIILTNEDILQYNKEIRKKADMVYDIENISSLSKQEILNYINHYSLPKLPKYDGNTTLTKENTKDILDNRNISQIQNQEKITKGIIIKRANLRSFPTDVSFYDTKGKKDFDRLQESELLVNTPVLIIHESKDGKWNFVISPFYTGWTKKDNIAIATNEDYEFFIKSDNFAIITDAMIKLENTILDMSVRLPYVQVTEDGYQLILPCEGTNGYVAKKQITVGRDKAHIGFLPYTKKNVYIQAFKYEGVNYSWGGKDVGVDCSSYIGNIYRTFGFLFPRNTSTQNKSVGDIISLSNKTSKQKLDVIKDKYPSLLYQSGHVMLYLGQKDDRHYIIHASGAQMRVTLTELTENSSYIRFINRVVTIN